MTETERSRDVDQAHAVGRRLAVAENDADRTERARELGDRLATTLDHVQRAAGRRRLAERRLKETRGAWGAVLGELRASLSKAEQAERDAGHALSVALGRAHEALASWSTP